MSKVLVGNISDTGEQLLRHYLNEYMPNAIIEALKPAGIRGKIKNQANRPDITLIILNEALYNICEEVVGSVLSLPKIHKYIDDEGLKLFLEEKFKVTPIIKSSNTDVTEEYGSLTVEESVDTTDSADNSEIIQRLNDKIIVKDMTIRSLEDQLAEKDLSSDTSSFVTRIKALEKDLEKKSEELSLMQTNSFVDLGKVARAEQVLSDLESCKKQLAEEKTSCVELSKSKNLLLEQIKEYKGKLSSLESELENKSIKLEDALNKINILETDFKNIQDKFDLQQLECKRLESSSEELKSQLVNLAQYKQMAESLKGKVEDLSKETKSLRGNLEDYDSIKVELANARIDLTSAREKRDSLLLELKDLDEKLSDYVTVNSSLREKNKEAVAQARESEVLNETLRKEIASLKSHLNGKDIEISALNSSIDKLNETNTNNVDTISELRSKVGSLSNDIEKLQSIEIELKAKCEKLEILELNFKDYKAGTKCEVKDLNSQIDILANKLSGYEEIKVNYEDSLKQLEAKIAEIESLNSEIHIKDDNLATLSNKLQDSDSRVTELSNAVNKSKSECESLSGQIDTLNVKLTNYKSSLEGYDALKERFNELSANLQSKSEEMASLEECCKAKESRVKELESEIKTLTSDLVTLKELKIGLNEQLTSSNSEVEELKAKLESCKEELISLKSKLSAALTEGESRSNELKTSKESIDNLTKEVEEQRSALERKDVDIKLFKSEIESTTSNLTATSTLLQQKEEELKDSKKSLSLISNTLESSKSKVASLEEIINNLNAEIDAYKVKAQESDSVVTKLNSDIESLNSTLSSRTNELHLSELRITELDSTVAELNKSLSDKSSDCKETLSELESLRGTISQLKANLLDCVSEKDSLLSEVSTLQSDVVTKNIAIDGLSSDLNIKKELMCTQNKEIIELTEALNQANSQVKTLSEDLEVAQNATSNLNEQVEEIRQLRNSVSDLNLSIEAKISEVDSLTKTISQQKETISNSESKLQAAEDANKKLQEEILLLNKHKSDVLSLTAKVNSLSDEILTYKNSIVKLESENKILRDDILKYKDTSIKDGVISKLQDEISKYKLEISNLRNEQAEKSSESNDELVSLRRYCAEQDITIAEYSNQITSISNSVFTRAKSIALPKAKFNLSVNLSEKRESFVVVASGSSDSCLTEYQSLKRYCTVTNKRILIVDLVTDSYIDREFGVERVISPIDFLEGTKDLRSCVSKTKLGNVCIVSTALNYFNSLYLLNVNWENCFNALSSFADMVIINIGCLNDFVNKTLFNTFSAVMKSHVIVKASPINLRTALLSLTGISSADSCSVSCINFESASKSMYQKLAEKFNTRILQDSDVLKL